MPWREVSAMSQREELVAQVLAGEQSVTALSRAYGVSRKTVYKWVERYRSEGLNGLAERSRRPQRQPGRIGAEVEARIVAARQQHPTWGGRKLKHWLEQRGVTGVGSASTVTAVLRRHGLLDAAEGARHRAYLRFERQQPNALWQMDFKGEFAVGRELCYPLTVLDDHARYLLELRACPNQQRQTVQQHLTALFVAYGLPEEMLMDNGSPWGGHPDCRYSRLTVWLLQLGIRVTHGRPYHPQTQGKEERLHRTLKQELLLRQHADSLSAWQSLFDAWRSLYNHQRPHEALGHRPPASRYQPSPRPFPVRLPEPTFPPEAVIRRVCIRGYLSYRGQRFHVGKAFGGLPLGICHDPLSDHLLHVYLGLIPVRHIDLTMLH